MPIIIAFVIIISGIFVTANVADKVLEKQIQQVKVETPSPSPTSAPPTSTPVPQVKINQVAPTPYDPIVDCVSDWQKQQGQTNKAKKSICDSWVDCQMGFGVAVRVPKEKCDALIDCHVGDIVTKTTSVEECEQRKGKLKQKQTGDMVTCKLSYGDFGVITREQCQNIVNDHVKKELHEKTLRDAEQLLIQDGYSPEEISKKLQELDQDLKAQGL